MALVLAGLRWIIDSNPLSGPVVLRLSATHGIHTNDWLTFVLWAAALVVAAPSVLSSRRSVELQLRRVRS